MSYPPSSQGESNTGLITEIKNGDLTKVNQYLDHPTYPANPNARDVDNKTALMVSASNIHTTQPDITQTLIDHGANTELTESTYGRYALHYSILTPNADVAQKLVDNGADVNVSDLNAVTVLMYCAIFGVATICEILLDKSPLVDVVDNVDNMTALMFSAKHNSSTVAELIIDAGADTEKKGNYDFTAWLWAGYYNSQSFIETVSTLVDTLAKGEVRWLNTDDILEDTEWNILWIATYLERLNALNGLATIKFNLNMRDDDHPLVEPVLIFATRKQKLNSITNLLNNGANPKAKNDTGETALHAAIETENMTLINTIITHPSVDPDTKDLNNKTVLMAASKKGLNTIVSFLISQGASLRAKDIGGATALMHAASQGHTDVLTTLLNADPTLLEIRDYADNTPLLYAADLGGKGNKDSTHFLINYGANVNASNNQYQTALMWAAKRNYVDTISLLVGKGADISIQDTAGWDALKWANEWGNDEAEALLRTFVNPNPEISISNEAFEYTSGDSSYTFPDLMLGQESEEITITITNMGTAILSIESIDIDNGAYVLNTTNTISNLSPNVNTTFTIQFVPESAGAFVGHCTIANNDPDESKFEFTLTGFCTEE